MLKAAASPDSDGLTKLMDRPARLLHLHRSTFSARHESCKISESSKNKEIELEIRTESEPNRV